MYLSYSGFKSDEQCPYSYWHRYVNKTTPPKPDNGINALYGTIIGGIFEIFYRDKLWRFPDYQARLEELIEPQYKAATTNQKNRIIDWTDEKANYHSKVDLIADVRESIPRGIRIIRENRLIGREAGAEVKLDSKFGERKEHLIGGRADFIIRRVEPHGDLTILDGKGSKHRDKYVDGAPKKAGQKVEGTQLKWYAMLYRAQFNALPDKLGYVFWRFDGEEAMEWVPFTVESVDRLQHEVVSKMDRVASNVRRLEQVSGQAKAHDELRQELFPAQAGDGCRFCSYVELCEEGKAKMAQINNAARRKPRVSLPVNGVEDPGLCLDDE